MYSLGDFVRSSTFYKHLLIAVSIVVAITAGILFWIKTYTKHGQTIEVPDLREKSLSEAKTILESKNLRIKVMDSIFNTGAVRGAVIEQNPAFGLKVKENRTIYVTINAFKPPQVAFPNIKDVSLRQAEAIIKSLGLELGNIKYVPDIAKDAVLGSSCKGVELKAGNQLVYGSKIDLILGDGLKGEKIDMPDLTGLTRKEAHNILKDLSLVIGSEIFSSSFTDSSMAKVYKQTPQYTPDGKITIGSPIDLFYGGEDEVEPEQ
jgi:eukaryotic-like serine/threonine-protein kinase